jgi:hypothetical protein
VQFLPRDEVASSGATASEPPIESIEARPVGAEVISFARYAAMVAGADVPLGLIEAAPVSALEVSPLASLEVSAYELFRAEPAVEASAPEGLRAAEEAPTAIPPTSPVHVVEALSPAEPAADAAVEAVTVDAGASAALEAVEEPSSHVIISDEMPRDEVLALALAATDAPTLEVLALALTVDDPPHHDENPAEVKVESEITVELCALDLNTVRMPTLETPALDLSANEISALDLRPVETIEIKALTREAPRARPKEVEIVDDEAPTVEVKALAVQELEAERAPIDDGDDITLTYVPPK